jgi:putative transposase
MARRSTQLELPRTASWGGRRRGAGRPVTAGRRTPVRHRSRPKHDPCHPVHVTLRARRGIRSLRADVPFHAVRSAIGSASTDRFWVIHFSVQADHVHLLVEAMDSRVLALGIRALSVRIARAINRSTRRSGPVWGDRYHARALRTPREVRTGIIYVLQNWRKHMVGAFGIDDRSSGPWFDGWATTNDRPMATRPPVSKPRTWLAASGWMRAGDEFPSTKPL